MAWARVDDSWFAHPKVVGLSMSARGVWITCLSWSCQQRTDHVPREHVWSLAGNDTERLATELVDVGMWDAVEDGWTIVGWTDSIRYDPADKGRRAHIPRRVRLQVYERDDFRCGWCGVDEDLTLDHLIPWSYGGSDDPENLRVLCLSCNSRRGNRAVV